MEQAHIEDLVDTGVAGKTVWDLKKSTECKCIMACAYTCY
jgi:hypothetical protein